VLGLRRIILEEVDRLLSRPALVMHAGVDDETNRAPHVVGELAETRVGILVEAEVVTEAFTVKAPAFDECGKSLEAAEHRHVAEFLLQRELQVVARHGFVHGQNLDLVFRAHLGFVQVHPVDSRPAAIARRS